MDYVLFASLREFLNFAPTCPFCSKSLMSMSTLGISGVSRDGQDYYEFHYSSNFLTNDENEKVLSVNVDTNEIVFTSLNLYVPFYLRRCCPDGHYTYESYINYYNEESKYLLPITLNNEMIDVRTDNKYIKIRSFYKGNSLSIFPARTTFMILDTSDLYSDEDEGKPYSEINIDFFPLNKFFKTPLDQLPAKIEGMICLL